MDLKFIQLLFYVISRKDKLSLPARRASKLSIWGGGEGRYREMSRNGEIREIKPVTSDEWNYVRPLFFFARIILFDIIVNGNVKKITGRK